MKKPVYIAIILIICSTCVFSQEAKGLKVLISVDMEGIAGAVNWEDVRRDGKDYDYFRLIMTKETNAAIVGAIAAGAREIIVRDSHGSARNILPEELDRRALLLRDWSGDYKSMMEGVDESFDAVICVGYHAKAGTDNAIMDHTMSSRKIEDVSINGISLPEIGINALIAGMYDVPVIFVAGDQAICDQAKSLFGDIETVAVKKGIGEASLGLHPEAARNAISLGVKKALTNLDKYKPYKMPGPYTLVLTLLDESFIPKETGIEGIAITGPREQTFKSDNILDILKAMRKMY